MFEYLKLFKALKVFKKSKNNYFEEKQNNYLSDQLNQIKSKVDAIYMVGKKTPRWRVIQDKNGETIWLREGQPTYVGKVHECGDRWNFDIIVDSQNISFTFESLEEAQQQKLLILDIERIEKFDDKVQNEPDNKN